MMRMLAMMVWGLWKHKIIEASWHVAQPADSVSGDDLGGGGENEDDHDD